MDGSLVGGFLLIIVQDLVIKEEVATLKLDQARDPTNPANLSSYLYKWLYIMNASTFQSFDQSGMRLIYRILPKKHTCITCPVCAAPQIYLHEVGLGAEGVGSGAAKSNHPKLIGPRIDTSPAHVVKKHVSEHTQLDCSLSSFLPSETRELAWSL